MKVLVSRGEGDQLDDFSFTDEGELLVFPVSICETPARRAECGCGFAFSGLESQKATTVGTVQSVRADELRERVLTSRLAESWGADAAADLWDQVQWIDEQLADVPIGAVVRTENTPESCRLITGD